MSGDILIFCFRTEKTPLELGVSHPYIKSVFSGKKFLSSQFFLLMFCFYFLCLIMIDKKMVKGLAIMSLVMLQANIFVPTGISLAEEGESFASTVQGESLAMESSSVQEDLASPAASAEESVTGTAAQVFEEVVQATGEVVDASGVVMPSLDVLMSATGAHMSGELSAGIISSLGMNVGGSTLVKYFTIGSDDEIPLLMKDDGTVDYTGTKLQYSDTTDYYLNTKSQVVDF